MMFQVADPTGPILADFLGAFLLAGGCGTAGAVGGHVLVRRMFDVTPVTSLRRAGALGGVLGICYPAAWVVALYGVRRFSGWYENVPSGGGPPALVTTILLGGVLLFSIVILRWRDSSSGDLPWLESTVFVLTFAVVLPVGFTVLLPVFFPSLAV